MKNHHPPLDFSKITNEVYLGTNACCQTHFDASLLRRGIRADISLEKERLETPWGVDFFLWLPTRDHASPSIAAIRAGVTLIHVLVRQKIKIYIHCKNGHGRAPTLVSAYLMRAKGMTASQAIAYVQQRRPSIHLEKPQVRLLHRLSSTPHKILY